jgi:hypothetical protein
LVTTKVVNVVHVINVVIVFNVVNVVIVAIYDQIAMYYHTVVTIRVVKTVKGKNFGLGDVSL